MAEIIARAKMAPLHLEADVTKWSVAQFNAFEKQLEAHISHTRHLSIDGDLRNMPERLISPAPTLESLSIFQAYFVGYHSLPSKVIPVNLFNGTTPSLASLELSNCNISWKSPLLKGLQTFKIYRPSSEARPKLEDWLDGLNEMPHLNTLILDFATPLAPLATPISEPSRTVTLPSLTKFYISAFANEFMLAFAHLVMPALTWLHAEARSQVSKGEDMQLLIPYISRNVYGLLGAELPQCILIDGRNDRVFVWTTPDADLTFRDDYLFRRGTFPARFVFNNSGAILDALLTFLPMNSVSTLTARNHERLGKEFWVSHAPKWPLLERARLYDTTVKAFMDMLAEDAPPDGPRLPVLTNLILYNVTLTAPRTYYLRDMLIKRVEQGVPLKVLDLRKSFASDRAVRLLRDIVVEVKEPEKPTTAKWHEGVGYRNEDVEAPWSAVKNKVEDTYDNDAVYDDDDDEDDGSDDRNDDDGNDDDGSDDGGNDDDGSDANGNTI